VVAYPTECRSASADVPWSPDPPCLLRFPAHSRRASARSALISTYLGGGHREVSEGL
jgi:hypothetical protein